MQKLHKQKKSEPGLLAAAELPDVPHNTIETPTKSGDNVMNQSVYEQSQGRSDTASFSNMKQKFYYANKILALQRKIAEQVRTPWS